MFEYYHFYYTLSTKESNKKHKIQIDILYI